MRENGYGEKADTWNYLVLQSISSKYKIYVLARKQIWNGHFSFQLA